MQFRTLIPAVLGLMLLPGAAPMCDVSIDVDALRSQKGLLQFCLTRNAKVFPDCDKDPAAHRMTVSADTDVVHFSDIPPGEYAIAVLHDENSNARLDTFAGIPREGVGFSRNPKISFGPPSFSKAQFDAESGAPRQKVRMRYFL